MDWKSTEENPPENEVVLFRSEDFQHIFLCYSNDVTDWIKEKKDYEGSFWGNIYSVGIREIFRDSKKIWYWKVI